jgi:CO dehydrogenase maturation factor
LLGSVEFEDQAVVADLEAGIGTLTRLGDKRVDHVLVVVEPTPKSVEVGVRAADIAQEKSLGRVIIVASRVRDEDDLRMITDAFPGHEVVPIPDDAAIVQADREGVAPLDVSPESPAVSALVKLAESLLPVPA